MTLTLGQVISRSVAIGAVLGAVAGEMKRKTSTPTGNDFPTAVGVYGRPILKGMIAAVVIGVLGFYAGKGAAIGAILGVAFTHQQAQALDPYLFSIGVLAGGAIGYAASLLG